MPQRGRSKGSPRLPAVLLLGDSLVTDARAREVIDEFLPRERQQLDLEIVRPPDQSLERVIDCLTQVGMFDSGRCVWVRGLVADPDDAVAALLEYLDGKDGGLPAGCSLVATCPRLDQRTRLFKWFHNNGTVIDLRIGNDKKGRLDEEQVARFVRDRFEENGLPLPPPDVLSLIASRSDGEIGQLAQEIDKICLATEPGAAPDKRIVRTLMPDRGHGWVFDLTNAVSARDLGAAQRVLERLVDSGEPPLRLLALLATHVAELLEAARLLPQLPGAALRNAGAFARDYFPKLPPEARNRFRSGFRAFYVLQGAAQFGPGELRRLHGDLVAVDLRMKSSRVPPLVLLTGFLHRACAASRR